MGEAAAVHDGDLVLTPVFSLVSSQTTCSQSRRLLRVEESTVPEVRVHHFRQLPHHRPFLLLRTTSAPQRGHSTP